MLILKESLEKWQTPDFETTLKQELQQVDKSCLPLQAGLVHSSYVGDSDINIVILSSGKTDACLIVKIGVFYGGIIAGSCCADDPSPVCEQNEYCEMQLLIDSATGETDVQLISSD